MSTERPVDRPVALPALGIDAALVVVFCVIGRVSHAEGILGDIPGFLHTVWPFLAALLIAYAVLGAFRVPVERVFPGIAVWVLTVVGGLLFRTLSDQGTATSFVIVTALTLAVLLLGWRLVLALLRRRRRGRP